MFKDNVKNNLGDGAEPEGIIVRNELTVNINKREFASASDRMQ